MPIITIDCETKGLDARHEAFLMGCITDENYKHIVFYKWEELWEKILELSKKAQEQKKTLNIYGHNLGGFDFWSCCDWKDKRLIYFSERPFIATLKEDNKEQAKFLDTHSIFRMPLKKLGELVNLPKLETPLDFTEGKEITKDQLRNYVPYMVRDSEICMKAIHKVKEKLKEDNIYIKRLYTIHQIAIQYVLTLMKKRDAPYFWYNKEYNQVIFTKNSKQVHEAYRGGRTECFKTGHLSGCTYIDMNNLYSVSATEIIFPDLRYQRKLECPLNSMQLNTLLDEVGVSRALIRNNKNKIGLLSVRTNSFAYYPKEESIMIGTYTHIELKEAIKEGYEILDIEWSILFGKAPENPYKDIMPYFYKKRKSGEKFDDYFYKAIPNNHIGKLGQIRTAQEIVIDSIEETEKYIQKGYERIKGIQGQMEMLYRKDNSKDIKKPYYCPIIPALITSQARVKMYRNYKKVGSNDLVYTDNDSIIFQGNHLNKFKIGKNLGEFKIQKDSKEEEVINRDMIIWGRKAYGFKNLIRTAGISKNDLNEEDFEKGYLEKRTRITMKNTSDFSKVGMFVKEKRNLNEQLETYKKTTERLENTKFLMDFTIPNISYFLPKIKEICK